MQQIRPQKLSDVIVKQLEDLLLQGQFLAGERLPSERELAERFAVSRPSLREAIQKLEAKGLVYRKQGGGTYVQEKLSPLMTDPLLALISEQPESQFDLLEFRHALEGMAAYYAALRGNPDDLALVKQSFESVTQLDQEISAQSKALVAFYIAMCEASKNIVLTQVIRSLQGLLEDNICRNLTVLNKNKQAAEQVNLRRKQIVEAILDNDPEAARKASNEHLAFIEKTLLDINREDLSMQRAIRRI